MQIKSQKQVNRIHKLMIDTGFYRQQILIAKELNINKNSLSHALSGFRTGKRHSQILDMVETFLKEKKQPCV